MGSEMCIRDRCYDKRYSGWSKTQCDEANGYHSSSYGYCYISDYYCPYVSTAHRKCYVYTSESYDCSSCRLLGGFLYGARCYHISKNCSAPLFLASNGQCYENQTTMRTAADCDDIPGNSFYDDRGAKCYFTIGLCSSGHYVNCQCFIHRSTIYTADSCLLYTSPSPRDGLLSRMPSSA